MLPAQLLRNENELAVIKAIAQSGNDGPVLMLNLNRYKAVPDFQATVSMATTSLAWKGFCPPLAAGSSGASRCMDKRWANRTSTRFWPPGTPATRVFSTYPPRRARRKITACGANAWHMQ